MHHVSGCYKLSVPNTVRTFFRREKGNNGEQVTDAIFLKNAHVSMYSDNHVLIHACTSITAHASRQ